MAPSQVPIEQLLADLHHPDFMTRCDAARELGKSRDPRAAEALLPDLNDPDWRVRRNAAQALGALKAKEAVDPLILALKDRTMTVRVRASVALGRIKDPRAIPALVETLYSKDGKVYESAFLSLQKFGKACIPVVTAALASASQEERFRLLQLLAKISSPEAVPGLLELYNDPRPLVRYQALLALANIRSPRVLEVLLAGLSDPDEMVRMAAAQGLGNFKDPRVAPALLNSLTDHEILGWHSGLYRSVALAMQQLGGLDREFAGILKNTPLAMAGMMGEVERQALDNMLSNYEGLLRAALEALSPGGFPSAAPLKGLNFIDQMRDAGAISARQVDQLIRLLQAPDPLARAAAALSLAWYRDARALEPLAVSSVEENALVRRAAAWAFDVLRSSHKS